MSVLNLTIENFEEEIMKSDVPVLIDFWASWCGPCRMMSPVVDEIANDMASNLKVCKVNVDEQGKIAEKYNVMSIPTFIVIKDGKEVSRTVGAMPKSELEKLFK